MSGRFSSISGSARQWSDALAVMDRTNRLSPRQKNALLDQVAIQLDAERALVARELQRRLEARKRSGR